MQYNINNNVDKKSISNMKIGRKYFFYSICHLCRKKLEKNTITCIACKMVFYCSFEHMKQDDDHKEFCTALMKLITKRGGQLYEKKYIQQLTPEDFQTYRVLTMNECKNILMRPLQPFEQEIILFPRICRAQNCGEINNILLENCPHCGEVVFCKKNINHLDKSHKIWCFPYLLLKLVNIYQEKYGIYKPILPHKILQFDEIPRKMTMNILFKALEVEHYYKKYLIKLKEYSSSTEYALITLAATAPLTAWYGLKLTDNLKISESEIIIHLIGSENEFEIATIQKWEAFFLHVIPHLKILKIVFIGPELQGDNSQKNLRLCKNCYNKGRIIKFFFEKLIYHEYCQKSTFQEPNLICFYNSGLHRATGFNITDTWPLTIQETTKFRCPIIVTSYTHYESPLDLKRFMTYSNRKLDIILPPVINPFFSKKAERNFISDEKTPLIFKNFYCFIIQ